MALDVETAAGSLIRKVQKALGKGSQAALLAPLLYARDGLAGPDQHRSPDPLAFAGEVEAPVGAVDEVHVNGQVRTEHRAVARGYPAVGVRGRIARDVGLGLDDSPG